MMMAAEGGGAAVIVRFTYTGAIGERIPREATHITIAEDCTFVRARAFIRHQNIVEVICHDKVERIEREAFDSCPKLRRVIMPGVKIVEGLAFGDCRALTDVECDKLEIIEQEAFWNCRSLMNISLLSTRVVEGGAFESCEGLTDVKFSSKLERFDDGAFFNCYSLERITIPLKDGLITADNTFQECDNLMQVDLVERVELHDIVAALNLEDWRNDMNEEIGSIDQILPDARAAGEWDYDANEWGHPGEKAQVIRTWISSVLGKIIHYQAEHQRLLTEAAATLQCALPHDILTNSVLPFVQLPSHTFEVEDQEMEDR